MTKPMHVSLRRAIAAMPCPLCSYAYTKVMHAQQRDGGYRRRRKCLKCEEGFVTYEITARELQRAEEA